MTPWRSLLFIPADSEKKLARADGCGADAVILDLEDSVAPEAKGKAREAAHTFLAARPPGARAASILVRINPLSAPAALADLSAVMRSAPDGIVLPKADGPADVARLSHYLDALEAAFGVAAGATKIVAVATETAAAPFALGAYASAGLARLAGLTWGAEDLSAALGAATNQDPAGGYAFTYRMARALTLLAARAAGVQPIDTLYADFRDETGLRERSAVSSAEGFTGRLAIHPAQVAAINEAYSPTAAQVERARRVVAAFDAAPGAGVVALDGAMLDRPHLLQARAVLERAADMKSR